MSKSELEMIQLKLLKKVIYHYYKSVPYYKQLMIKNKITINDIQTLDDIERFPILTKQDVLSAGNSIVSTKYPEFMLRQARTGAEECEFIGTFEACKNPVVAMAWGISSRAYNVLKKMKKS